MKALKHYPVKFEVDGVTYNCAEQYMMHQKAVVFKDSEMSGKIMATSNPVEQKSPRDRLWGIGLGASNPKARIANSGGGKNLLGQILTEVRDELMKEEEDDENSD
nr:hypothetical protein BaRGS_027877 [Batillaria attramentaria]